MVCNKLLKIFGYILGFSSFTGLLSTGIYYIHKFEEMDCGNLQVGVGIGIVSLLLLVSNFILYISTCCESVFRKFMLFLSGISVIVCFLYNFYLYEDIEKSCKEYYQEENIWDFYKYFMVTLFVNTLLVIGIIIAYCKSSDKTKTYPIS